MSGLDDDKELRNFNFDKSVTINDILNKFKKTWNIDVDPLRRTLLKDGNLIEEDYDKPLSELPLESVDDYLPDITYLDNRMVEGAAAEAKLLDGDHDADAETLAKNYLKILKKLRETLLEHVTETSVAKNAKSSALAPNTLEWHLAQLNKLSETMRGGARGLITRAFEMSDLQKAARTTGGKKSRKLRKRTTIKGGKRKRRRTRRRR